MRLRCERRRVSGASVGEEGWRTGGTRELTLIRQSAEFRSAHTGGKLALVNAAIMSSAAAAEGAAETPPTLSAADRAYEKGEGEGRVGGQRQRVGRGEVHVED